MTRRTSKRRQTAQENLLQPDSDLSSSDFEMSIAPSQSGKKAKRPRAGDVHDDDGSESAYSPAESEESAENESSDDFEEEPVLNIRNPVVENDVTENHHLPEPPAPSVDADDIDQQRENQPPRRQRRQIMSPLEREQRRKQKFEAKMGEFYEEWQVDWPTLASEHDKRTSEISAVDQPVELQNVRMLPFQLEGLSWLQSQEETQFNGGILADSMGMGKTLQTIALLITRQMHTLVICPVVALFQWKDEIAKYVGDQLKVLIYHGASKVKSIDELKEYDVVLSTYAVVEAAFRKERSGSMRKGKKLYEKSLLHQIHWGRIVLDEAHSIKDRSCSTARSVFALKSTKKWSLSGTPLQNRVGELYSLIRFLQVKPYSCYYCTSCPCTSMTWMFSDHSHCDQCGHRSMQHFCWWNRIILKPIQKYGPSGDGLDSYKNLGILLDQFMLRRTKDEKADDLGLPPRIVDIRRDYFNEFENDFYHALFTESKTKFAGYIRAGTVLNNYAHIFDLLSKLRQAADHPFLVVHKRATAENPGAYVCGICHDIAEDPISSKCKHVFCREDIRQYMSSYLKEDATLECPVCFSSLNINLDQDELPAPKFDSEKMDRHHSSIVNRMLNSGEFSWTSSTKIEALLEELDKLRQLDRTIKSIVFSQFVSFLDLIYWRLQKAGFNCVKLDGRMTPQQRDSVIKSFMNVPQVTVFLVSLKAGGVALNLTEASRIFIMDPWYDNSPSYVDRRWNPAVEDQAMDRIHRLGQRRPVRITRIIIEDSIESRIVQLQEKKNLLFQSTVGKDAAALDRLTEEDLGFLFQM